MAATTMGFTWEGVNYTLPMIAATGKGKIVLPSGKLLQATFSPKKPDGTYTITAVTLLADTALKVATVLGFEYGLPYVMPTPNVNVEPARIPFSWDGVDYTIPISAAKGAGKVVLPDFRIIRVCFTKPAPDGSVWICAYSMWAADPKGVASVLGFQYPTIVPKASDELRPFGYIFVDNDGTKSPIKQGSDDDV